MDERFALYRDGFKAIARTYKYDFLTSWYIFMTKFSRRLSKRIYYGLRAKQTLEQFELSLEDWRLYNEYIEEIRKES